MAAATSNTKTDLVSLARQRLILYVKNGGDKLWRDDAFYFCAKILDLLQKTSGRNGVLELEKAIANQEAEAECIFITPNTESPYFKVSKVEYRPDVALCKLWRWANLLPDSKIEPIAKYNPKDEFNHHLKGPYWQGQGICVNPYHYTCANEPVEMDVDSTRNVKLRLLGQKKDGGDQNWKRFSVEYMWNVFNSIESKESSGLYELEKAINTENPESDCVLIEPTSPDFQVRYPCCMTFIVSYKLWRCPDLRNSNYALEPIDKYGGDEDNCHVKDVDKKYESICVNPYHYKVKVPVVQYVWSSDEEIEEQVVQYVVWSSDEE